MKTLFIALSIALLSGCTFGGAQPAQITVGAPKHRVEPPSSSIAGYKSIEFPVRVTNTSKQPVWFYGQFRDWPPFYSLFVRPTDNSRWADHTQPMCGIGADFHKLAPGAFIWRRGQSNHVA